MDIRLSEERPDDDRAQTSAHVDDSEKLIRLSVKISSKVWDQLCDASEREGITSTMALSRSLVLYNFVSDQMAEGATLEVRFPDGTQRSVVFIT